MSLLLERKGDRFLSPAEAGALLGVHPETVRRWAKLGEIPGLRVAGTVRIRESDLAALMAAAK